ncbi:MAG TPA: hypothetical protein VGJ60_15600 [Chloroflexota bacterium]|jgi:hypothetical protein
MDVAPVLNLIGNFTDAAQKIAPALAALGFITSELQAEIVVKTVVKRP